MGIFSRLSDIFVANLHALLDRAEDPERMIAQIIREMEDGLARARRYAASAIAAERHVARELERNIAEAQQWQSRARQALVAGREDLARRALRRKHEHDELILRLRAQREAAWETSEEVRTALRALEARLAEARRKQAALVARHQAAKARRELCAVAAEGIPDPATFRARFDRLEHQLLAFEDEALALGEIHLAGSGLEGEIGDLENERAVSQELHALKQELHFDAGTPPEGERS
jgi:phage shock protein A